MSIYDVYMDACCLSVHHGIEKLSQESRLDRLFLKFLLLILDHYLVNIAPITCPPGILFYRAVFTYLLLLLLAVEEEMNALHYLRVYILLFG